MSNDQTQPGGSRRFAAATGSVKIVAAILVATALTGCAAWKASPWTPDGFSYTVERDRRTGEQADYFGLNWNLKP
jgi:hypothetical protein